MNGASPFSRHAGPFEIGRPGAEDGPSVHRLIELCPPLEQNSLYCNLLQCTHFSETCVIARRRTGVAGFLSAYLLPERPDELFIWQVAVAADARRQGLGAAMLAELLARRACLEVRYLLSTVTESNRPSWSLFEGLARRLGTGLQREVLFERARHLAGRADSEILVTIGPLERPCGRIPTLREATR